VTVEAEAGHLFLAVTSTTGMTLHALQGALEQLVRTRQRAW
jgi:hypothetical protein